MSRLQVESPDTRLKSFIKLTIAFCYCTSSLLITAYVMVLVHDRVPGELFFIAENLFKNFYDDENFENSRSIGVLKIAEVLVYIGLLMNKLLLFMI